MIRTYRYHACPNKPCALFKVEAPGDVPGWCPRCGYLRRLARIVTRAVGP